MVISSARCQRRLLVVVGDCRVAEAVGHGCRMLSDFVNISWHCRACLSEFVGG